MRINCQWCSLPVLVATVGVVRIVVGAVYVVVVATSTAVGGKMKLYTTNYLYHVKVDSAVCRFQNSIVRRVAIASYGEVNYVLVSRVERYTCNTIVTAIGTKNHRLHTLRTGVPAIRTTNIGTVETLFTVERMYLHTGNVTAAANRYVFPSMVFVALGA